MMILRDAADGWPSGRAASRGAGSAVGGGAARRRASPDPLSNHITQHAYSTLADLHLQAQVTAHSAM